MAHRMRYAGSREAFREAKDRIELWTEGQILNFKDLPLERLPKIPEGVTHLICENTALETLENLPKSLMYLDISGTPISQIPELPESLTYLDISYSEVRELPRKLPSSLQYFYMRETVEITRLPELPDTLKYLDCSFGNIESLPEKLPASLEYIDCSDTNIAILPENLPPKLHKIDCDNTELYNTLIEDPLAERQKRLDIKREKERQENEENISKGRCVKRCKLIKRGLMRVTWHPDRVLDWCDPKAFDFDD